MSTSKAQPRPKPAFSASAVIGPALIIVAGILLYEHFRHSLHDPFLCVTIILVSQVAAFVAALGLGVCGWRRGERPWWLAIAGAAIAAWFLSHLLFAW
jgi:hypothetical protein